MKRSKTTHIVIHTAAWPGDPSAEEIRRVHVAERGWEDIGYHWVVRKDGTIEPGRDEQLVGAHCAASKMNYKSVGICMSGDHDNEPLTAAQVQALVVLVGSLMREYDIPAARVIGHREAGAAKTCPGERVDMDWLREVIGMNYIDDVEWAHLETVNINGGPETGDGRPGGTPKSPEGDLTGPDFEPVPGDDRPLHEIALDGPGGKKKFAETWLGRTLAGRTRAGKIGAAAKNVAKYFIPKGHLLDQVTDRIGAGLKIKGGDRKGGHTGPPLRDLPQLLNLPTMFKSKNPGRTAMGLTLIAAGIATLFFGSDGSSWDFHVIAATVAQVLTGTGLLAASDGKRKDEGEGNP